MKKFCKKCLKVKEFSLTWSPVCIDCAQLKTKLNLKKLVSINSKRCTKCGKVKHKHNFRQSVHYADGLRSRCKECESKYGKIYNKIHCTRPCIWDKHRALKLSKCADQPHKSALGNIEVVCKKCGEYFEPTSSQISNRLRALKRDSGMQESSFYCSKKCKDNCDAYNTRTDVNLFSNKYKARSNQQSSKRSIKESQIDAIGHTFCELCGADTVQLELHHTIEVAKTLNDFTNIDEALKLLKDKNGHILLCKSCHAEIPPLCAT